MQIAVPLETMKKAAAYVEQTQPRLAQLEKLSQAFEARIPGAVDALVAHGLLSPQIKQAMVAKLAGNPELAFDMISELAGQIKAASLGGPADKPSGEGELTADQAFERRVLG